MNEGMGYCHARPQLWEKMVEERKCSPSSRLVSATVDFDESLGWNKTTYEVILDVGNGCRMFWQVECRTLSMMVVE